MFFNDSNDHADGQDSKAMDWQDFCSAQETNGELTIYQSRMVSHFNVKDNNFTSLFIIVVRDLILK